MKFLDLGIDKEYIKILKANYIVSPTEVQEKTIPLVLKRKNMIVCSQTGTGKTLAYLLPILSMIDKSNPNIQAMILAPTRELADQITKVGKLLTKNSEISVRSVFGGHRLHNQANQLTAKTQIIVGTPGRILDHSRRGSINLKNLNILVIDEADQMLNYGFIDDIYLIHSRIPADQQVLLFSATIRGKVAKLISDIIPNPVSLEITPQQIVVDKIKQLAIITTEERRLQTLLYALEVYSPFMAIIFTKSKERAKKLYHEMISNGYRAIELLHGELSQSKRENIIKNFRQLKLQFLISTDISARGIDVSGITHIFNFDVPLDPEYYVHRIGRTARMGNDGCAITLVDEKEMRLLEKIEKYAGLKVQKFYDRSDYERSRLDREELINFEVKDRSRRKVYKEKKESPLKGTRNKAKKGKR